MGISLAGTEIMEEKKNRLPFNVAVYGRKTWPLKLHFRVILPVAVYGRKTASQRKTHGLRVVENRVRGRNLSRAVFLKRVSPQPKCSTGHR